MSFVRRCLGCSYTYLSDGHACPECGSHAGEVEEAEVEQAPAPAAKAQPARPARRPRKT